MWTLYFAVLGGNILKCRMPKMEAQLSVVCVLFALAALPSVNGYLFDYGGTSRDSVLPTQNDVSVEVKLASPFTYYGKKYDSIFINDNGVLSFGKKFDQYVWETLPLFKQPDDRNVLIAPLLADVDVTNTGTIFYGQAREGRVLQDATALVSQYFVRHSDFKPKNMLIVTWDKVGFQGSTAEDPVTNTFQCVVISDAINTFAFFLYEDISWTTAVSAGGDPQTGSGSDLPQVGFDSGDWRNYEILRVQSDYGGFSSLPLTSNVDPAIPPGLFIFHVSGSQVESPECSRKADPQVYPRYASILGGSKLTFGGSCFSKNDDIKFRFSDKDDPNLALSDPDGCEFVSAYQATCIAPMMYRIGEVKASLSINSGTWRHTSFTLMPIDSVPPGVLRVDPWTEKWYSATDENVQITWDKSVFNDTVNVTVMSYREKTAGNPEWVYTLVGGDVPNSGAYTIQVGANPAITPDNVMGVLRVTDGSEVSEFALSSSLHFLGYLLGEEAYQRDPRAWSNKYCEQWYEEDKKKGEFVNDLNACPCSLEQALADQARFVASPYCDSTKQPPERLEALDYCFARPEIKHCVLGVFRHSTEADSECCYDGAGNLVYAQDSIYGSFSSRISRFSGAVPGLSSAATDLVPYIFCNVIGKDDNHYYRQLRPTRDCRDYEPVRPAMVYGDPHFVTFDDMGYTFNGLGDFILVRTVSRDRFEGRFVKVIDDSGNFRNATVLAALAVMQEGQTDKRFEIKRDEITLMTLSVGRSGTLQDIRGSDYQQYPDFFVIFPENDGSGIVPIMIILLRESQIGLVVEASEDGLSAMVLLPSEYKGMHTVEGLFGNWDEDKSNDLKGSDGQRQTDMTPEAIYEGFGQSWRTDDSLFTDREDVDGTYRPIFQPPTGGVSEQELKRVCGDDKSCRFDYAVTGKETMARGTAEDAMYFKKAMAASNKLLMCPFPPTPSHGEKRFVGEAPHHAPGSTIRYECDKGYIFLGNSQRECNEKGEWSDTSTPSCTEIKCGTLNAPEDGSMEVTEKGGVISATFECDKGMKLEGSEKRTCAADNRWTGEETKCVEDGGGGNTAVIVVVIIIVIIVVCVVGGGVYYYLKKRRSSESRRVTRPSDSAYKPVATPASEGKDVEMGVKKDKPGDEDSDVKDKDKEEGEETKALKGEEKDSD
ncbi:sushi domain-containing protein 2-like [Acanthaster planci]|uniref:Sushi domain-containing protein 2-like n=1 Tax=Acanthaster planci TaxID=133434 RepID=A0A8B7Z7J0_ACAPL|nr:sushi domain-containing protein 2-like [Acanthaster planci]